ncbi:hypothetical protein Avbf_19024 [Armadillidium vulgare]|nr:hypothetical protein Avbf_19024 [Armadillidium vulgare]
MNSCKTSRYFTLVGGFAFMLHRLTFHFFNRLWKIGHLLIFVILIIFLHRFTPSSFILLQCGGLLPLGDDQVDVMLSRDLDSEILKREYDAVSEWLNSTNKSLHIMRDHPFHCITMLGGTWGIRVTKPSQRRRLRIIRQEMFKSAFNRTNTRVDQTYLTVNFNDNV